jgi:hypothetical protein
MNMAEVAREIVGPGPLSVLVAEQVQNGYPTGNNQESHYMDIEPRTNPTSCDMTQSGIIGPYNVIYCCHALSICIRTKFPEL